MANFGIVASEPLFDMWFDMATQDGITIEQWTTAARLIMRTRKFTSQPTYADFHEIIYGIPANKKDFASEQSVEVLKQVRELGYYRAPVFNDPITKALMSSRWSWHSVCSMTEDELTWWVKEFMEAYQATERLAPQPAIDGENSPRLKLLTGGIGRLKE